MEQVRVLFVQLWAPGVPADVHGGDDRGREPFSGVEFHPLVHVQFLAVPGVGVPALGFLLEMLRRSM